jgi:hypothetical protein
MLILQKKNNDLQLSHVCEPYIRNFKSQTETVSDSEILRNFIDLSNKISFKNRNLKLIIKI